MPIGFHHELAHTPAPPTHIFFYCYANEGEGGSTPIIRADVIYDYINERFP